MTRAAEIDLHALAGRVKQDFDQASRERISQKILERMAPPGGIPNISALLEARRLKYGIPDGAFKTWPSFDVCFVQQISRFEGETYGNGNLIVMTDTTKQRVNEETPRGVLVSAGLNALDCLRSNGIEPGHIVSFMRLAPWRMPIENLDGKDFHMMILRVGDITGSEDLSAALARGECRITWDEQSKQHLYLDAEGRRWTPTLPFLPDDY